MMKKKLFLLITCSVLFSSVTAFFVYRKRQLAEIARKEEERKRQEEEQKKKENEGNQKETNDNDDTPWMYNLTGMLIDLIISFVVSVIIFGIITEKNSYLKTGIDEVKYCALILAVVLLSFIFIFFYIVVFPLIFAIKKYRNKSYRERFKLICKKFYILSILVTIVFFILTFSNIIRIWKQRKEKKKNKNL